MLRTLGMAVIFGISALPGYAAVWYVDKDVTGTETGTSWAQAFNTIQEGIDAAAAGDEIWVAEGRYNEARTHIMHSPAVDTGSLVLKNNVFLYGGFAGTETTRDQRDWGSHDCIIDGSTARGGELPAYHVVVGGNLSGLDGFVITGGAGDDGLPGTESPQEWGAGMYNDNVFVTVANCVFTNNRSETQGGAMYNHEVTVHVTGCVFADNTAHYGAGLFINGNTNDLVVKECIFRNNQVSIDGGAVECWGGGSYTFTNCLLNGNSGGRYGGAMMNGSGANVTLINCTFWGNSGGEAALSNWGVSPVITNCILWGNTPAQISGGATVSHSDVQGGFAGDNNINQDPLFNQAGFGDFSLRQDSPCIDTGMVGTGVPSNDLDGRRRPIDIPGKGEDGAELGYDMGAFEFMSVLYVDRDNASGTETGMSWAAAFNTIQEGIDASSNFGGGEVWVAEGVYNEERDNPTGSILMKQGVHLYGGFAGTETALSGRTWNLHPTILDGSVARGGGQACHVLIGADNATLDGFTITGGNGNVIDLCSAAGGMLIEGCSPLVTNCIFTGNQGNVDAAMSISAAAAPVISNCVFDNNEAATNSGVMAICGAGTLPDISWCAFTNNTCGRMGGAIVVCDGAVAAIRHSRFIGNSAFNIGGAICNYNNGTSIVSNCLFEGNETRDTSFGGGAIGNWKSRLLITNCTLVNNTTANQGGAIGNWNNSISTVKNCIVWGNAPQQLFNDTSTTNITYSDVMGGFSGEGNINADPRFVAADDFHLSADSPCIDMGTATGAPPRDLDGQIRPVDIPGVGTNGEGDGFDMGAYEYVGTAEGENEGSGEEGEAGHAVTMELTNVDDAAYVYLNDVLVLECQWGWDESGTYTGHHVGYTGEVQVPCARLAEGANTFDFLVWNAAGCCGVTGNLVLRVDGTEVYNNGITATDSTEGFKFSDSHVLNWTGPCVEEEGEGEGESCGALGGCLLACGGATSPDVDGDGLTACVENCVCTDDTLTDTDGDGLPDVFELNNGLNPNADDANGDLDADGIRNLDEYLRGSSPVNRNDPRTLAYVAPPPFGNDAEGDGSLLHPWATLGYALDHVNTAPTVPPAQIAALTGDYPETVMLKQNATVSGAPNNAVRILGSVTGANNSGLENLEVAGDGSSQVLLDMNDVAMRVIKVRFTGTENRTETGILADGTQSGQSVIDGCEFAQLASGIDIAQDIPLVRKNVFSDLAHSAIILRETAETPAGALGDSTDPAIGCNTFAPSIEGPAVLNERGVEIKMELNDWGTNDPAVIAARISGPGDFEPFLATGSGILAASLYCTVWNARTQERVGTASVEIAPGAYGAVTENVGGVYAYPAIPNGNYTVTVSAPNYVPVTRTVLVASNAQNSVIFPLEPETEEGEGPAEGEGEGEQPDCHCGKAEPSLPSADQTFIAALAVAVLLTLSRRTKGG